jgi:hypothetical protein
LEFVSISVLAGNEWPIASPWCCSRDGTCGPNFLAFLPKVGSGI